MEGKEESYNSEKPIESKKQSGSLLQGLNKVKLNEDAERFYDMLFKSLGIIGALIAFFWGIWEFKISNERDYNKEFYIEQIKIMREVVNVTSTLSSYPETDSKYIEAKNNLNKLRAGELYLFSDNKLNDLMGEFFSDFQSFEADPPGVDQNKLENLSSQISGYCHDRITELSKLYHE